MFMTRKTEIPKSEKHYGSELEKRLMVQNLRVAVEIYGKDQLRKQFKSRKMFSPGLSLTRPYDAEGIFCSVAPT